MNHLEFTARSQIVLQPVDLVVALKLCCHADGLPVSRAESAVSLGISRRRFDDALARLVASRLASAESLRPRAHSLMEFLCAGVPYWLPAEVGAIARGMPAATSGPGLEGLGPIQLAEVGEWVWPGAPAPFDRHVGKALQPIDPIVPTAAARDQRLYELLSLLDALRIGRVRERDAARAGLSRRLGLT
jgi:hypothetical protein